MPEPMVPAPSTPTLRTARASALDARIALGEEQMPERARRAGSAALLEAAARKRERGVERLARGRLHTLDDGIHGRDARKFALRRGALARDRRLIGRAALDRSLAQAPRRRAASRELAGIRERGCLEGAILGDAIDDAELGRPRQRMGSPLSINASAGAAPMSRGKRCVPPDPGSRPSRISGKPNEASGAAMR